MLPCLSKSTPKGDSSLSALGFFTFASDSPITTDERCAIATSAMKFKSVQQLKTVIVSLLIVWPLTTSDCFANRVRIVSAGRRSIRNPPTSLPPRPGPGPAIPGSPPRFQTLNPLPAGIQASVLHCGGSVFFVGRYLLKRSLIFANFGFAA